MTTTTHPLGEGREKLKAISNLNDLYETMTPVQILEDVFARGVFGDIAVVSSFGAESAVLLHMVSRIRPDAPVLMIDTGKLFGETLQYRNRMQHLLGLEDIRACGPRRTELEDVDPMGTLSATDPDACCHVRKTLVLKRALKPFDTWINGRKRYQSDKRSMMSIVERDGERLKVNPLANWSAETIKVYMSEHDIPSHPLVEKGYRSIGCYPCTSKVAGEDNERSGRWAGLDKTECGIHD